MLNERKEIWITEYRKDGKGSPSADFVNKHARIVCSDPCLQYHFGDTHNARNYYVKYSKWIDWGELNPELRLGTMLMK